MPSFSDDEVIDFLVAEGIIAKAAREQEKLREQEERTQRRKNHRQMVQKAASKGVSL